MRTILYVGSLVHRKGVDTLIRGVAGLRTGPPARLVIAGEGPERRGMEALARELGVRAEFLGHVAHDHLPDVMCSAQVFVLASRSDAAPRVAMEAMAAGMACVVTRIGDLPAIVKDTGVVLADDAPSVLSEALDELFREPDRMLDLGRRARTRALAEFDIERRQDDMWRIGLPGPRILFVLPKLDLGGSEHFIHTAYLAERLPDLRPRVSPRVLALRSADEPLRSTARVMVTYPGKGWASRIGLAAREFMACGRGDVIYVRISIPAIALALFIRPLRGYRVAVWHSTWKDGLQEPDLRIRDQILGVVLRRTDLLVTFPRTLEDFYINRYRVRPERVRLVPNNVSVADIVDLDHSTARFVFVGRLSPRKGAQDLPAIAAALGSLGEGPIDVIGDGPLLSAITEAPGLRLCGGLPNRTALAHMRAARVVLMPSYAEGCSRVLQEAIAIGVPVVFYDIEPSTEVAGPELAELAAVPTGDSGALARRAALLAGEGPHRERVKRAMTSRAADYTSEAVARSLVQALDL